MFFLLTIRSLFPLANLQDVYKSAYQDYFGAEHMMSDSTRVAQYLLYELEHMDTTFIPEVEPCGWRHRYERVSLQVIRDGKQQPEQLLSLFLRAHDTLTHVDSIAWREEWQMIADEAVRLVPEWRNDTLQSQLMDCAEHCYAVHHSRVYHDTYKPHYRIVKR